MRQPTVLDWELPEVERKEQVSFEEFYLQYLLPCRPLIVTRLTDDWPARSKWTPSFFRRRCGRAEVRISAGNPAAAEPMKLADYMDYLAACRQPPPLDGPRRYLVDWSFKDAFPELLKDLTPPDWADLDWLKLRPGLSFWPTIFVGPAGSYSPLHCDVYYSHAWNSLLAGRKKFFLLPPDDLPLLEETLQADPPLMAGRHAANFFDVPLTRLEALRRASPVWATLEPGETLFTPCLWQHAVVNLEESIAVTGNWFDESCPATPATRLSAAIYKRGAALSINALTAEGMQERRSRLSRKGRAAGLARIGTGLRHFASLATETGLAIRMLAMAGRAETLAGELHTQPGRDAASP